MGTRAQLALHLNESALIAEALHAVDLHDVPAVASAVPPAYVARAAAAAAPRALCVRMRAPLSQLR